jgi:hypothetical protein
MHQKEQWGTGKEREVKKEQETVGEDGKRAESVRDVGKTAGNSER